jgi:hypothetical protein
VNVLPWLTTPPLGWDVRSDAEYRFHAHQQIWFVPVVGRVSGGTTGAGGAPLQGSAFIC